MNNGGGLSNSRLVVSAGGGGFTSGCCSSIEQTRCSSFNLRISLRSPLANFKLEVRLLRFLTSDRGESRIFRLLLPPEVAEVVVMTGSGDAAAALYDAAAGDVVWDFTSSDFESDRWLLQKNKVFTLTSFKISNQYPSRQTTLEFTSSTTLGVCDILCLDIFQTNHRFYSESQVSHPTRDKLAS